MNENCVLLETNKPFWVSKRDKFPLRRIEHYVCSELFIASLVKRVLPFRVHPARYEVSSYFDNSIGVINPLCIMSIYDFHVVFWDYV